MDTQHDYAQRQRTLRVRALRQRTLLCMRSTALQHQCTQRVQTSSLQKMLIINMPNILDPTYGHYLQRYLCQTAKPTRCSKPQHVTSHVIMTEAEHCHWSRHTRASLIWPHHVCIAESLPATQQHLRADCNYTSKFLVITSGGSFSEYY